MPTLTDRQIAGAVRDAGWPRSQWTIAVAVALAESSGRSDVVNSIGASGLFQILRSAHADLFRKYRWNDPTDNARMALEVYHAAGNSWRPWVAYTSGSYRRFLSRASTATGNPAAPGGSGAVGSPTPNVVAAGFPSLTSGAGWKRIGWYVSGASLLLLAVVLLMKLERFIPAGKALKVVRTVRKLT